MGRIFFISYLLAIIINVCFYGNRRRMEDWEGMKATHGIFYGMIL
jgi:hypothetical protein